MFFEVRILGLILIQGVNWNDLSEYFKCEIQEVNKKCIDIMKRQSNSLAISTKALEINNSARESA